MTSINNINGYGVSFNGGYPSRKQENQSAEAKEQQAQVQPEAKPQVKADDVMKFLEANNVFVAPAKTSGTESAKSVDPAMQSRIEDAMAQFEVIYSVIAKEFGEGVAPHLMDLVMDKLMGVAA